MNSFNFKRIIMLAVSLYNNPESFLKLSILIELVKRAKKEILFKLVIHHLQLIESLNNSNPKSIQIFFMYLATSVKFKYNIIK